jgi:REP element-mobilizing transposase RayT
VGEPKTYYQRHLPHYQPEDATYHVVVRLAGSLPSEVVQELKRERERILHELDSGKNGYHLIDQREAHQQTYFERFDTLLDGSSVGPTWLRESAVAAIVKKAIHYRDARQYDLIAYSIMPNHVHLVIDVGRVADPTLPAFNNIQNPDGRDGVPSYKLTAILASLKKYTALRANRELHRSGAFWQDESYDRVIHDDHELERTLSYVLQNPVKAGLANSWEDWPWNYSKWDKV